MTHRPNLEGRIPFFQDATVMQTFVDPGQAPSGLVGLTALCRAAQQLACMASPIGYRSFCLGAETYGLFLSCIQEVRSYQPPTRVANAPEQECGVLNLSSIIVPVVDLRLRFQVEASVNSATASAR